MRNTTVTTAIPSSTSTSPSSSATTDLSIQQNTKCWRKDGVNGGPSSMIVLINWIQKKNNFYRWYANHASKKTLCIEITDLLKAVGIHHRKEWGIRTKMENLLTSFMNAEKWKEQKSQRFKKLMAADGLEEETIDEKIDDAVKKMCPEYFDLEEVMGGKPEFRTACPSSSHVSDPEEVMELFFPTHKDDYESEEEVDIEEIEAMLYTPRRPPSVQQKPRKRAKTDSLEKILAEAIAENAKIQKERNKREEKRIDAMIAIQEKRLQQERELIEIERESMQLRRKQKSLLEVEWRAMLVSLGYSSEEVSKRMDNLWK